MLWVTKSENTKTGNLPQCYSSERTCPDACLHKHYGSCYAMTGPVRRVWKRASDEDHDTQEKWDKFIRWVTMLPPNQLWRYGVAGDLPGENNTIDEIRLLQLVKANAGKKGYTYTHKPMGKKNRKAIAKAVKAGFCINLSADNLKQAARLQRLKIAPVVVTLAEDVSPTGLSVWSDRGYNRWVVCPAQLGKATCATCKMCADSNRKVLIAFRAHGVTKKRAKAFVC